MSDASDDEFHSIRGDLSPEPDEKPESLRFSPSEENLLVSRSNSEKAEANRLFGRALYGEAIQNYDRALSSCPNYLDYEIAVLRSNISACHIKLEEWKEATEAASKSLDALERLDPRPKASKTKGNGEAEGGSTWSPATQRRQSNDGAVEEVDDQTAARIEALEKSGRTRAEVQKIRIKALLRRAKARSEQGGWASLQGADEDYRELLSMPELLSTDRRSAQGALAALAPRLEGAKNQEMGEMMDKLKGLGNSILKPFGLSTDNFQFVKDENTGGYSMNFNQGQKR